MSAIIETIRTTTDAKAKALATMQEEFWEVGDRGQLHGSKNEWYLVEDEDGREAAVYDADALGEQVEQAIYRMNLTPNREEFEDLKLSAPYLTRELASAFTFQAGPMDGVEIDLLEYDEESRTAKIQVRAI